MSNNKEFTRLMNRLDDYGEKLVELELELKELRHELNLAVINGELNTDSQL